MEVFEKLLPLARNFLQDEARNKPEFYDERWLPGRLYFAAQDGNLAMMEHLFELGVTIPPGKHRIWFRNPVRQAAKHGRKDALAVLLRRGFVVAQEALEASVQYGYPETVQFVLNNIESNYSAAKALLTSVEKENDTVIQMLLAHQPVAEETRVQALQLTEEMGLDSMRKLIMGLREIPVPIVGE